MAKVLGKHFCAQKLEKSWKMQKSCTLLGLRPRPLPHMLSPAVSPLPGPHHKYFNMLHVSYCASLNMCCTSLKRHQSFNRTLATTYYSPYSPLSSTPSPLPLSMHSKISPYATHTVKCKKLINKTSKSSTFCVTTNFI